MKFFTATLDNGIRIIHMPTHSKVSHCGIIINAGARDEKPTEAGIAHLTEHMLFKGTHKRKAFHILSCLDDVGGELDAYTTKEDIAVYASFLNRYYQRTVEMLSDVVFNSVFPAKELVKEHDVICDEINSYRDNPSELIFDDFESLLFASHPLGNSILGTEESIKSIGVEQIHDFVKNCFNTDQMVFCSVGNISFNRLMLLCNKYLLPNAANKRRFTRKLYSGTNHFNVVKNIDSHQAHCIIGNTAYSYRDEKRLPLILLSNVLAGPVMNSRLNLLLREKHGITYNIEAVYTPYYETGNFCIYFGTDTDKVNRCMSLINKELKQLCETPLGVLQLSKAKKQIVGQMALGSEMHAGMMLSIGKSFLLFDEVEDFKALYLKIEQITASEIREIANEICHPDKLSSLIFS